MLEFFKEQMDYIYFFYGLALFMLAAVCFIMMKEQKKLLPLQWGLLGLFGLFNGAHEWLDIFVMPFAHNQTIEFALIAIKIVSFCFLLEFGLSGLRLLGGKSPGRWIYLPLLGFTALGGLTGLKGMNAASKYSLVFVGGLLTSYIFFALAKNAEYPVKKWLFAAGAAFAGFTLSAVVAVSYAPFFPASVFTQSAFLSLARVPIQFFRGIFAVAMAVAIWGYSQVTVQGEELYKIRGKRIILPVFILNGIVISGWLLTHLAGSYARDENLGLHGPADHIYAYRLFTIFATFVVFGITFASFAALHFNRKSSLRIAASERRYRSLVEGSPNCVVLFDSKGVCLTINRSGVNLLGYEEHEVIGKPLEFIWTGEAIKNSGVIIEKMLKGMKYSCDAESLDRDGKHIIWNAVFNPVSDFDSEMRFFVGIFMDITDRRKAEEELKKYQGHLEELVRERTLELSKTNQRLNIENTERLLVEDALRDSENRFRSLFNIASDAIFLIDPTHSYGWIIVDCNISACSIHGYIREELIGQPITFLDAKEDTKRLPEIFAQLMAGSSVTFEITHVRKNGSMFPVEVSAQFVDIGGNPYVLAIERDITERKRAEERLKLFSKAIEEARDGIQITDLNGYIVYSNSAVKEIYGFSDDDLLGTHVNELAADGRFAGDIIIPAVNENGRWDGELTAIRRDGSAFAAWVSASVVTDEKNIPIAIIGIIRDITERRQVEEELKSHREHLMDLVDERTAELKMAIELLTQEVNVRKNAEDTLKKSEEKYRHLSQEFNTLLDAIPDSLMLLSPKMEVLWANQGAARHFGVDMPVLTGRRCYDLWHGATGPCEICPALLSFSTGHTEERHSTLANGTSWDIRAFPIKGDEGQVSNVIVLTSEVTEKIKLEAEAMRASHLAALGELAAGVAHEINNPINGIINYAQLLTNKSVKGSSENDISARIVKEGERIAGIVRNLLSFARERKAEKQVIGLKKVLGETINLTEVQIRKDGINIRIDLPENLPELFANPQQLQQVFLNLISNSRYALNQKYPTEHQGKVLEISAETVSGGEGLFVRMCFFDQGAGIPAEIIEKVINPFFSTKPGGQGTGLGLSISHGIIKDHGGILNIESEEGVFTRIIVDLPVERCDSA